MNLFLSVILLNLLFVVSAIGKIKNFSGTVKSLKNVFWVKNLPNWFFNLSIVCVIILLLVAPSTILYSSCLTPNITYILDLVVMVL